MVRSHPGSPNVAMVSQYQSDAKMRTSHAGGGGLVSVTEFFLMRHSVMRQISLLSSLALCLIVAFTSDAVARPFRMFEAMLFSGTPDFTRLGLQHLRIVDVHELWKVGEPISTIPTLETIRKITAAGVGPSGYLVIDIEHWAASDANYKLGET